MSEKIKNGCFIVIIGKMKSGKSPIAKKFAENSGYKNLIVYDHRREYDENKYTLFYSFSKFKKYFPLIKKSFVIVEEATVFVNSFKDDALTDVITGIEHNLNTVVFLFHSLRQTPPYMLDYANYVIFTSPFDNPNMFKSKGVEHYLPLLNNKNEFGDVFINNRVLF